MIVYDKLFIGGRWTEPATTELLDIRSPHDRSLVGRAAQASPIDVDQAVSAAREAFDHGPWPRMTPGERQAVIARFSELHAARTEELAALVTSENGSAIWFTRWTHTALAEQTSAYLRAAESFGWEERLDPSGASGAVVRREPVGPGEDGPGAARGLHRRPQGVARDRAGRAGAGRDLRRGGIP